MQQALSPSSIFSPFLDLASPSFLPSPNLESSWIQISRDDIFSPPPFDRSARHDPPTDSVITPHLGVSLYEDDDDIETGDSDEDEDAAVEEALRASLATLLATRNLSQYEMETRAAASSPKTTVIINSSGNRESASSNQGKNATPRKPTIPELRYHSASPEGSINLSVPQKHTRPAPHHSRSSAQQNAYTFLDRSCLFCSLHLCQRQSSNQHRVALSSPSSPKGQFSSTRRSASCPTTPRLLTPHKKKVAPLDPSCASSQGTPTPGDATKNRDLIRKVEDPTLEGQEAKINPNDANDKNTRDTIFAWIAQIWLNAGFKIKVLSAMTLSAILLGTGLFARSSLHPKSAISTTIVLRL